MGCRKDVMRQASRFGRSNLACGSLCCQGHACSTHGNRSPGSKESQQLRNTPSTNAYIQASTSKQRTGFRHMLLCSKSETRDMAVFVQISMILERCHRALLSDRDKTKVSSCYPYIHRRDLDAQAHAFPHSLVQDIRSDSFVWSIKSAVPNTTACDM